MNNPTRKRFHEESTTHIQNSQQRTQQASFHSSIPIPVEYTKQIDQIPSVASVEHSSTLSVPKVFPNRICTDRNLNLHTSQEQSMFLNITKLYGVNFQFSKDFSSNLEPFLGFVRAQPTSRIEKLSSLVASKQLILAPSVNFEDLEEDTQRQIAESNSTFVELAGEVADLLECYLPTIESSLDSPDLPAAHLLSMNHNFMSNNTPSDNNNNSSNPDNNKKTQYKFKQPINKPHAFDRQWRRHFDELAEFKAKHGHCNVSRTTKGYENLGNWLADQRRKLRRGKMTKEQYGMLSELGKVCT